MRAVVLRTEKLGIGSKFGLSESGLYEVCMSCCMY